MNFLVFMLAVIAAIAVVYYGYQLYVGWRKRWLVKTPVTPAPAAFVPANVPVTDPNAGTNAPAVPTTTVQSIDKTDAQ